MINLALVDDHSMFREGVKALIAPYEEIRILGEFSNGGEALNSLPQDTNIVLMDLEMPGISGIETMEALRSKFLDVQIIFLSQNKNSSMIGTLMELGANGYLSKDSTAEELHRAIISVHQTGFYFNEIVSRSMLKRLAEKDNLKPGYNYLEELTEREMEILKLVCEEFTTAEIGEKLFISPKTVENHRSRIMSKTGAKNTAGLVVYAFKNKIIDV